MKKLIFMLGIVLTSVATSLAHARAIYGYSYTYGSGDVVTGSFTGDASGNLITNLSSITASLNSVVFNGSGHLYGSLWDKNASVFVSGAAVASFDGTQNNFLFSDVDTPDNSGGTNFFDSIPFLVNSDQTSATDALTTSTFQFAQDFTFPGGPMTPYNPASWTVTLLSNSVPEPSTVSLLSLALFIAARRRKSA